MQGIDRIWSRFSFSHGETHLIPLPAHPSKNWHHFWTASIAYFLMRVYACASGWVDLSSSAKLNLWGVRRSIRSQTSYLSVFVYEEAAASLGRGGKYKVCKEKKETTFTFLWLRSLQSREKLSVVRTIIKTFKKEFTLKKILILYQVSWLVHFLMFCCFFAEKHSC